MSDNNAPTPETDSMQQQMDRTATMRISLYIAYELARTLERSLYAALAEVSRLTATLQKLAAPCVDNSGYTHDAIGEYACPICARIHIAREALKETK